MVRDADEDNLLRRSSLDNRLRKDVKTVVDILRKAEVEDILRDATEEKDIPAVAVLMDNPEVDSEIGILEEDTIPAKSSNIYASSYQEHIVCNVRTIYRYTA